jgi:hypothetical protein
MRKFILLSFSAVMYCVFTGCNSASPEKYFDVAVLSANSMQGFAGEGMWRELESPSVKMIDGDINKSTPMKRKEIVDSKIESIEPNLEELEQLKETGDTKDILQAAIALHKYVLPVYKNEYQQLAKLYDENAAKETIQAYTRSIYDKYFSTFAALHDKLTAAGKVYAEKHKIKVNWDIHTSPQ